MIDARFVLLGAALNLLGSVGYAIATIRGETHPNRVTWLLWAVAPMIAFAAQISEGVGLTALMTFMVGFGPLVVFLSSFSNRSSYWTLSKFDWLCGILSVCALAAWRLTGSASFAIWLSILADALAAAPTVLKATRFPHSEKSRAYLCGFMSAVITLLSIQQWSIEVAAFPVWILTLTGVLLLLINFPRSDVPADTVSTSLRRL